MYATEDVSWCRCAGCGAEAELPAVDAAGVEVPCPDCADPMAVEFSWESAA
ncbi:hypothetical protein [Pseudonocardia sp. HH130630-07]|uniref:hypothetical protein n=1 Tax=Pseudonocardia sp. HH130630-07 TaxID=1690815 RepID=UPI0012EA7E35|nr:hypothetical protein [Pseudonocardia sp. HH130630-07]